MTILIGYKNKYGKYKTAEKTFNDEKHYYNWYTKFIGYGNKLISQEIIS